MSRRLLWLVSFLAVASAACSDAPTPPAMPPPVPPEDAAPPAICAEEFFEGTVTFPDGAALRVCSASSSAGIVARYQRWATPGSCMDVIVNAEGASVGAEPIWSIRSGADDPRTHRGDWFRSVDPLRLFVRYAPEAAPPAMCRPGFPLECALAAARCEFELTQAGVADGDIVEGHLTAPCEMDPVSFDGRRPTLTAFHFRSHLSGLLDYPDAGPCVPFP